MCPLLEVLDLSVQFHTDIGDRVIRAVNGASFHIEPRETVALVGESGCGKSATAMAIMGLLKRGSVSGSIRFGGRELTDLAEDHLCKYRGASIAAVFQDPMTCLNPIMPIGKQIAEGIIRHFGRSKQEAMAEALELLKAVGIPDAEQRLHQYPHELSGGMRQRVMIAIAIACRPQLLIADEPTTSLDVTTQAEILALLRSLQKKFGMSLLFITHDFGVIAGLSDRVVVMQHGRIIEMGAPDAIYHRSENPYVRDLVRARRMERQPATVRTASLVEVKNVGRRFPRKGGATEAVIDASFTIFKGETLALVGESGSGKSTLARLLLQLDRPDGGTIAYEGEVLYRVQPKRMQIVFQNPYSSLDPRLTIRDILWEPYRLHRRPCSEETIVQLLVSVGLDEQYLFRRPAHLSGGQRQRVSIARALAVDPELVILDEPLSALDLMTQRQILNLLTRLKEERGMTYLFITHDLSVVKEIADRVLVMHRGRIVETAEAATFFELPAHPYSEALLHAVPFADPREERLRMNGVAKQSLIGQNI